MNRVAFLIDTNGFVTDSIVVNSEEEYVEGDTVAVQPPIGISFYKMRWNGTEWVEGETEEEKYEREAIERPNALHPSSEELDEAKTEIKILTLLSELEMI